MASPKELIQLNTLKTECLTIAHGTTGFMHFDEDSDELMLMFIDPNVETTVHYIDSNVGILFRPETLDIVGLQVEGFVKSFAHEHSEVEAAWSLSEALAAQEHKQFKNLKDLQLFMKEKELNVALEIIKVSEPVLGQKAKPLREAAEKVFA